GVDASVFLRKRKQLLVRKHEAVEAVGTDRVRNCSFPHEATKLPTRIAAIGVLLSGAHARDASGAYEHSAWVVGQRRPLDVEEDQRLLGLKRAEEGVQHDPLVLEVVDPDRVEGQLWLACKIER